MNIEVHSKSKFHSSKEGWNLLLQGFKLYGGWEMKSFIMSKFTEVKILFIKTRSMTLINTLSGLLTPVIAVTTVYIAYQQYKTGKDKLRFDLYEKRLKLFESFKGFLFKTIEKGQIDGPEKSVFIHDTNEIIFLFGKDIKIFREALIKNVQELSILNKKIERELNAISQSELEKLQLDRDIAFNLLRSKYDKIEKVFKKYLAFNLLHN